MYTVDDVAWMEGFDSFQYHTALYDDNPYPFPSDLYDSWKKGWLAAKREFYENKTDIHPGGLA